MNPAMTDRRLELENLVNSLAGKSLSAVRYVELDQDTSAGPAWDQVANYDSVDFGVELALEADDLYSVTWSDEFYPYALAVGHNGIGDRAHRRASDVSQVSRWRDRLGVPIAAARLSWDWQALGSGPHEWGPQDLSLRFEDGGVVYLAALQLEPGRAPFGHANNVTVFFSDEAAREAGAIS
jgi:hypothetical protein